MATPALDPRYRPFRVAAWSMYIAVATVFALFITVSVIRSTLAMSPDHRPPAATILSVEECLQRARGLYLELDERRKTMSQAREVRRVDAEWTPFRVDWLSRHRAAESACAVAQPGRESLKAIYDALDKTMDLYTTHAVQFAGEVGPTLDALKASLDASTP
jgi:hypothetical protein